MQRTRTRRQVLELCAAGSAGALAGCTSGKLRNGGPLPFGSGDDDDDPDKIDDWQYDPAKHGGDGGGTAGGNGNVQAEAASDDSVGLAAGGAADVGTFRRNVSEGYLPIPETMSSEGLFHEYYFDTGGDGSCSELFCPTYTPAITPDPLSGETERYLSVGLDSGLSTSDFERPPLNLVIVLDVSGSMRSSFEDYYYDEFDNRQEVEGETDRPKLEVAKEVLADLTEHLRPDDRLGVVLFNNEAKTAKPMRRVDETDMEAIREHIREDIVAGGGTNISAGMQEAEGLLDDVVGESDGGNGSEGYEHRSILLTDAQINLGETRADELQSNLEARAAKDMHVSFVGVGVDFNADLIHRITSVRGANYYSVYSADQFEDRLVEEFEYMVTPLVFDLSLELDAEGYEIEQVYGSPSADEATGDLLGVNTLFPSPSEDGKAKGGVVLVQVERTGAGQASEEMELQASWEERDGSQGSATQMVSVPQASEHWGSDAVRKAVLLARHANLLKQWALEERDPSDVDQAYPDDEEGIEPPQVSLSKWELQSQPLSVSEEHADRIESFRAHLAAEMNAIGDDALQQEVELLDEILAAA